LIQCREEVERQQGEILMIVGKVRRTQVDGSLLKSQTGADLEKTQKDPCQDYR
jgi:hypothetical protein